MDDWKQFHKDRLAELKPEIRDRAIAYLNNLFRFSRGDIRKLIKKDPQTWWVRYHQTWGYVIRQAMRNNGFGEAEFGVESLDEYYVGLVEESVKP